MALVVGITKLFVIAIAPAKQRSFFNHVKVRLPNLAAASIGIEVKDLRSTLVYSHPCTPQGKPQQPDTYQNNHKRLTTFDHPEDAEHSEVRQPHSPGEGKKQGERHQSPSPRQDQLLMPA